MVGASRARGRLPRDPAPRDANGAHATDGAGVSVDAARRANRDRTARHHTRHAAQHAHAPPLESLQQAAQLLASSRNPAFLVGSRLVERDAVDAAVRVAEILGTPVISESGTTHGRLAFPSNHPLYALGLPLWSPEVSERLAEFDVILVAGMDLLRQYVYHEPARAIPEHVRIVHLDEDPWQLGKNYPLAVGVLGDVRSSLEELASLLETTMTAEQHRIAQERGDRRAKEHREARKQFEASIAEQHDLRPITPLTLMQSLSRVLPTDIAVIEEAVTTTNTTFERLGALKNTTGYFGHRGWALGWGLGCSLGVKLAWPNRPVLAMLGEGSAMYGIQGLWSAARYKLGVTFVICNNAQYQILKIGARQLELPKAREGRFLGLDLAEPEIDFVALARSLGVEAHRVTEPDELAERVAASLAGDKPQLFDVPIGRGVPKRLNYG